MRQVKNHQTSQARACSSFGLWLIAVLLTAAGSLASAARAQTIGVTLGITPGSSAGSPGILMQVANASPTGTTANTLTKLTGAPSTAVIASVTDTGGIIGITTAGAGTTGNATIELAGDSVSCVFDGPTTAGDYVQISSSTAGNCHDAGATYPASGQIIGRVLSTNAAGGTYPIDLFDEIRGSSGGGGSNPILTHTLSGAAPTAVVNSATTPAFDIENFPLTVNVTSITLPASTAIADAEEIWFAIVQGSGSYTLPAGGGGTALSAGTGTTILNVSIAGSCPTIGTAAGNELIYHLQYKASNTEYRVLQCYITNPVTNVSNGQDVLGWNSSGILTNVTPGVATNAQTGTSYTVAASDRGKVVSFNNAGAVSVTVPEAGTCSSGGAAPCTSGGAAFTGNFYAIIHDLGAGTVTLSSPTIAAPAAPSLSQTAGGTIAATTYFAKNTCVTPQGETTPSVESSFAVSANNLLVDAAPTCGGGATGWNAYVSTATGTETKQNTTLNSLTSSWTEPTTGLVAGAGLPTANTTNSLFNGAATFAIPQNAWCSLSSGDNINYSMRCSNGSTSATIANACQYSTVTAVNSSPISAAVNTLYNVGTGGAVFNLPAATGTKNCVSIYNNTANLDLTINRAGTDGINAAGATLSVIHLEPFQSIALLDGAAGNWYVPEMSIGSSDNIGNVNIAAGPGSNIILAAGSATNQVVQSFAPFIVSAGNYFQIGGHFRSVASALPAITASGGTCGAGDSVTTGSTDVVGEFTTGTGTVSSCVLTFAVAFTNAPIGCMVENVTDGTVPVFTTTNAALTVTIALASKKVHWFCPGPQA